MPLKTYRFSKNYFGYVFKRFFPYTLIMTLVLLAVNILVYSMGGGFRVGEALYLIDISIPTQIFMYIIPIILGCAQFHFLFTRKGSDFYGAMPVTRAELFNSNMLAGLASILMVIAVNTVYLAVSMPLVHPGVMVAPSIYVWYFFYWVIAYSLMFAITAFAATLSGTTLAQLVLTFVTVITPGFFITAFQNVVCEYSTDIRNVSQYLDFDSADMLIKVLFAPYYPIQQLFFLLMGHERFTGFFYDIQTWPMLICNIVMLALFIFASAKLLRRRKFELAGGAYSNEKLYSAVKILAVFPFAFFMWRMLADNSEVWLLFMFIIIITVFYILLDICLRKGLTKVKTSVLTYVIAMAFSFAVFMGVCGISALIKADRVYTPTADIRSFTVYMTPAGLDYSDTIVPNQKAMVKFTYDDEELINEFKSYAKYEGKGTSTVTMRVNVGGRSVFGRYRVSGRFMDILYELMEQDEKVWKKLDYTEKRLGSPILTTVSSDTYYLEYAVSSPYYYNGGYSNFKITDKEAAAGLLAMLDGANSQLKISDRYGYVPTKETETGKAVDPYYYAENGNGLRATFMAYIDGVYYEETYRPSSDADLSEFCKYLDMNAKSYLSFDKSYSVSLGSGTPASMFGAEFLGANDILANVCRLYGDEIVKAVKESETLPELSDTVIVRISDYNGFIYAPVSYENVIKVLVDKYLQASYEAAADFNYAAVDDISVEIYVDGVSGININVGNYYAVKFYEDTFRDILPYFSESPELYTSEGHLGENLKGKTVVELSISIGARPRYHFYAYINEELEKAFTSLSSPLFSNTYDTYLLLRDRNVYSLEFNGEVVPEGYKEYFLPYICVALAGGNYRYEYVSEVYCKVLLADPDEPSGTLKEYETWLVLNEEMDFVYGCMQKGLSFEEIWGKKGV